MLVIAGEINNNPLAELSDWISDIRRYRARNNSDQPQEGWVGRLLVGELYPGCVHNGFIGKNSQPANSIHNDNIERFTQSTVVHWTVPDTDADEQNIKVYLEESN